MSSTTGIIAALPQATTTAATGNTKPLTAPKPITSATPSSGASDVDGDSQGSTTASKSSSPSPFGPAVKVTLSPEATSILAAATGSAATE